MPAASTFGTERFVRGWKVSLEKLQALVGAKRVRARDVIRANGGCRQDVLMTLADGDEDEGRVIAETALTAILEGRLDAWPGATMRRPKLPPNATRSPIAHGSAHGPRAQVASCQELRTPGIGLGARASASAGAGLALGAGAGPAAGTGGRRFQSIRHRLLVGVFRSRFGRHAGGPLDLVNRENASSTKTLAPGPPAR